MRTQRDSDPSLGSEAPTISDSDEARTVEDLDAPLQAMTFERRYERERVLGEGGMGEILLYHDKQIGRRVATKVLRPELRGRTQAEARFVREARVQGQLEHPAVVPVYDLGVDPDGRIYFTMKRVRGVTLEQIIERLQAGDQETLAKYSPRRLLSDFSNVCLAVDFAHEHGVLHRDLKPGNIMLGDYGEVYVLDWGLARVPNTLETTDEDEAGSVSSRPTHRTHPGAVMGTPGYMSPEQTRGELEALGPRSDVYALGAILFEILTLTALHEGESPQEVVASTLRGADPRPSVRAPEREVAPELEEMCVRATALEPDGRFESTRALHHAIERFLDGQRDMERRRQLAAQHADKADEAASRALAEPSATVTARRDAMRDVGRALALDPDNERAMGIMVRLLGEPPQHDPPEVTAEMEATRRQHIHWVGRLGGVAYASLFLYLPLFFWVGVRAAWPVVVFYALAVGCSVFSLLIIRNRRPKVGMVLGVMTLSQLTFAATFPLFGPLVLTPTLIAVNTGAFALHLERQHRPWAVVSGAVAFLVPLALELSGAVPSSYRFTDEGMLITSLALELPGTATIAFLAIGSLGSIVTVSATVSGIRDGLSRAERQIYTYAWHLRELIPTAVRSETDATVGRRRHVSSYPRGS